MVNGCKKLFWNWDFFKTCARYFLWIFIFTPSNSPLKTMEKFFFFFFSSKKLFLFLWYSNFCISFFSSSPLFLPVGHCFRRWSRISLKVYDVINCLNKNLIRDFVWYHLKEKRYDIETLSIDRVLNKEHFSWKIIHKMCTKS